MKIIKKIGMGMFGTVFLVEDKQKQYAMKIQKILDIDMTENSISPIYREIEFNENIGSIYPEQFIQLYKYEYEENCKHIQEYTKQLKGIEKIILETSGIFKQNFINLKKSTNCVKFYYELMDGNLEEILSTLSHKQILSMFIQVIYFISILKKYGYLHNDTHLGNILYKKVSNRKEIMINNHSIPTYGYIYKCADYGLLLNKKYKMKPTEKKQYKNGSDLLMFMYMLVINFQQIWKIRNKKKLI